MGDLSLLPAGYVTVELFYSGAWQDVTAYLGDAGVSIERRAELGGKVVPSQCTLTLKNGDGRFSPRNPRSPLFGLIGRNTPLRITANLTGTPSVRFVGEVAEWPQRWTRKGAPSAQAQVVAAGFTRRLGQGASPLRSPLARGSLNIAGLRAYWPMEDGQGATEAASAVPGAPAMRVLSAARPAFGEYDRLAASQALPVIGTASLVGLVPAYANTGVAQVRFAVLRPVALPDTNSVIRVHFRGGTLSRVNLGLYAASVGREVWDREGVKLNGTVTPISYAGRNTRVGIEVEQAGADVRYRVRFLDEGSLIGLVSGWVTLAGQTLGTVASVEINPEGADLADVAIGHVTVQDTSGSIADVADEFAAWVGEKAHERVQRLCAENGVTGQLVGGRPLAEKMGPQAAATLLELVDEAAEVGQGLVVESRTAADTLRCITLETLYALTPTLDVAYVDNLFRPFEPTDDDSDTRNRVTVQRAGGSAATVEDTAGPLGTAAVGIYDEDVTVSLATDGQALSHAAWRVARGTHDEARWPVVGVNLRDSYWLGNATRTNAALAVDVGSRVDVSDLPSWLPPDDVRLLVTGYTETLGTHDYEIEWQCVPYRPFAAAQYGATGSRYDSAGTVTAEPLDATETGVDITHGRVRWAHDDGDYDVLIGGERMTVTDVVNLTLPAQRLTVVRGVNGVTKTHATGAAVELAEPGPYAL